MSSRSIAMGVLLLFCLFHFAGCASSPSIIGKWKVRQTEDTGNVEYVEVFDNGTILRYEGDRYFSDSYKIDGKAIVVEDSFLVTLTPDGRMIWCAIEGGQDTFVFDRVDE